MDAPLPIGPVVGHGLRFIFHPYPVPNNGMGWVDLAVLRLPMHRPNDQRKCTGND
jgi:hypothetical protein